MSARPLKLGIAGIGRAFSFMIPTFRGHPRMEIVAGFDPREEARARFSQDFGAQTFDRMEALCAFDLDAIYIASPHQFHRPQVEMAAAYGRHVLVEKPMALSLEDCRSMIAAVRKAAVTYPPCARTKKPTPTVAPTTKKMAIRVALALAGGAIARSLFVWGVKLGGLAKLSAAGLLQFGSRVAKAAAVAKLK
jgi:hypothetical protein